MEQVLTNYSNPRELTGIPGSGKEEGLRLKVHLDFFRSQDSDEAGPIIQTADWFTKVDVNLAKALQTVLNKTKGQVNQTCL
jgi:hypothetical protein